MEGLTLALTSKKKRRIEEKKKRKIQVLRTSRLTAALRLRQMRVPRCSMRGYKPSVSSRAG